VDGRALADYEVTVLAEDLNTDAEFVLREWAGATRSPAPAPASIGGGGLG
jgi:hypothetical protein